jgi:hypothetical protein
MSPAPLLVAAGLLAQGALLVPLSGAGWGAGVHLLIGAALAALVAGAAWHCSTPARPPLAMLAGGGLGMTCGWWADVGFASAPALAPEADAWCGLALAARGPGLHLLCWMNAGTLAAGALVLRLAHGRRAPAAAACDALAMALGMGAGAALAARLTSSISAEAAVVTAHAGMNAGMLVGMHLVSLVRIVRRRPAQGCARFGSPPSRAAL